MTKPSPAERIVHILTEMYYEKQRITQTATSLAVAATISSYFRISDRNSDTLFGYRIRISDIRSDNPDRLFEYQIRIIL